VVKVGNTLISIFLITLVTNIMIVSFGFGIDDLTQNLFDTNPVTGDISETKGELIGSINPKNFSTSGALDQESSDFKMLDALAVVGTGLGLLLSIFFAPLSMALALSWPTLMVMLIAVPWTVSFWISLLMLIRGVSP